MLIYCINQSPDSWCWKYAPKFM